VASESDPGSTSKTYDYTPGGARLSQTTTSNSGTSTPGYYSYNAHSDVEAVTGTSGTTTATYGYTAYGQPVTSMFTGADKTNATSSATSTTQPYRRRLRLRQRQPRQQHRARRTRGMHRLAGPHQRHQFVRRGAGHWCRLVSPKQPE
jgi:hypothetical protein